MLLSPLPDAPADVHALDFAWQDEAARLQVSTSSTFDDLVVDVPVAGLRTLSLPGQLPADGRTYFWRVGHDGAWSAPSAFRATNDDEVFEWEKSRSLAARDAHLASARETVLAEGAPGIPAAAEAFGGETSKTEAMAFAYFIVASFTIILILIFRAVV